MKRILKFIGCLALGCVGLTTLAETYQVADAAALKSAMASAGAGDVIELTSADPYAVDLTGGGYTLQSAEGVSATITHKASYGSWVSTCTDMVTVKGITWIVGSANYQYTKNIRAVGCTLKGDFCTHTANVFENCNFIQTDKDYNVWCYSGNSVFTGCTFEFVGKCANIFNEGNDGGTPWNIIFENCVFKSSLANKAALNVKSTSTTAGGVVTALKYTVDIEGCSFEGEFPSASTSDSLIVFNELVQLDDIKPAYPNTITITQDGRVIYKDNAPIPEPITVKVEKDETKGIDDAVVTEITGNKEVGKLEETGLKEALPAEELAKGEPVIKVQLQEVAANTLKFDVSPYVGTVKVESDTLNGKPVAVRLPLVAAKFDGEYAKVIHEGDPIRFVLVKKGTTGAYVDLTLTHFSEIDVVLAQAEELVHAVDPSAVQIQPGLWVANGETDMGHAEIVYSVGTTGLKAFRDWVNDGHSGEGQTFQLVADVDLGNEEWTPIAKEHTDSGVMFKGEFKGQGYAIYGLKITENTADEYSGLFGRICYPSVIRDLTLYGQIGDENNKIVQAGAFVGGLYGGGMLSNLTNYASVKAQKKVAGIVGTMRNAIDIPYSDYTNVQVPIVCDCVNSGELTGSKSGQPAAGIVAHVNHQDAPSACAAAIVRNCVNNGKIAGNGYVGGIVGRLDNCKAESWISVESCVNNGTLTGYQAGGIFGMLGANKSSNGNFFSQIYLTNSANLGNVSYAISGEICQMDNDTSCKFVVPDRFTSLIDQGTCKNYSKPVSCGLYAKIVGESAVVWYPTVYVAVAAAKAGDTVKLVASSTEEISLPVGIKLDASASGVTYDPEKITVPEGYVLKGQDAKVYYAALAPLERGEDGKYHITSLNDLKSFRNMVNVDKNDFAGETVSLDASIDLANEEWEPIGVTSYRTVSNDKTTVVEINAVFNGSFLGNGNTISNLKISATKGGFAYNSSVGFFGNVGQKDANTVISDLTIDNVHIAGRMNVGAIAGQCKFQTLCFTNCHVTGEIQIEGSWYMGGICGRGYSKVVDCSVIGAEGKENYVRGCMPYAGDVYGDGSNGYVGGIWGHRGEGSNVIIERCTVKNLFVEGDCNGVGGIQGIAQAGNKILGCTFENSTVRCLGGTGVCGLIAGSDDGEATGYGPVTLADSAVTGSKAYETISDEKIGVDNLKEIDYLIGRTSSKDAAKDDTNRATVGWGITFDANGKVVSGTFDQISKTVLAPGSVMDIDQTTGKIVVLGPLVPDDQGVYHIATMQDLKVFRLMVNGGNTFGGKTVVLDNDIEFVGTWDTGIGGIFRGVFDGQDHTIANLKITKGVESGTYSYAALFHTVYGPGENDFACVRNLTLTDVAVSAAGEYVAAISGDAQFANFENCKVIGGSIAGRAQVGGICGFTRGCNVIGCLVENVTISAVEDRAAGIVGGKMQSGGSIVGNTVKSCLITSGGYHTEYCGAAGLVGQIHFTDGTSAAITDNEILDVTNKVADATINAPIGNFRCDCENKLSATTIARNHWAPATVPDSCEVHHKGGVLSIKNFHPVAEIAGKGPEYRYETLEAALNAASALTGTVAEPTVVQLYPGEVKGGSNIGQLSCNLKNVVIQGAEDGTSTLTNCKINWQADSHEFENVTFKNIIFDNSRVVFSTNSKEKDMAFIGNTFRNLVNIDNNGGVHFNSVCQNLTYENNVFEGSISGSTAAINTQNVTGNITIRNNVFKNSCWRSIQLMFNAADGIADNVTITDNWFLGNASAAQIYLQGAATDDVKIDVQYNVIDDGTQISQVIVNADTKPIKVGIAAMDHNYFLVKPDENPARFYYGASCTVGNIYDAGVYPYYNAYYKEDLAAGTMTVRESLYNLVDPAAIVVNEDGKFVKATVAGAMAAAQAGESVMLIRDAADEDVEIAGEVTFDTNGKAHGEIKAAEGYLLVDLGGGKYIAKSPVAEIVDGQKYDTLEKAIAAVTENQTIKMLANVALTKVLDIPADKSFTLDLNGKKISDAETGFDWSVSNVPTGTPANLMIVLRGTMKVCDTSANQDGSIWTDDFGYAKTKAVLVADNGNLTLESGTIYGEYAGCYVVGYTGNDPAHTPIVPTLTLNGGVISGGKLGVGVKGMTAKLTLNDGAAIKSKAWYGISTNGTTDWYDGGNCQITVNGGLVECEEGPAIYNPAESIIQIKGGVVKGLSGIAVKGGNVTISGDASVIATGVKVAPVYVQSGVEVTGDAIYIEDSYENHKPVVSVIGGMLKSANGHAVQYWTNKAADKIGSLSIAGGSLIAAKDEAAVLVGSSVGPVKFIEAQVDEGGAETGYPLFNSRIIPQYIAEGYVEKDNGNGTWTVTKGQAEIEVVIKPVEPTTEMAEGMTEAEKTEGKKQADQIKENIVAALSDPSISDIVGTGVIDATYKAPGELWGYVVDALRAAAPSEEIKGLINSGTDVKSHVEITFESLEVKVAIDESEQRVVKSTLNKVKYEIKPILTTYITVGDVTTKIQTRIPSGQELANPIEFALSLEPSFVSEMAKVTHLKADDTTVIDTKTYPVKRDGEKAYIQLAWKQFSFADIEGQSVEDQVCTVNGAMYDSVATAAATADDGAVITLLKDIPSDAAPVPLKPLQVIELNGKSFDAPLTGVTEGYELAKTPEGQAFIAPEKIEVPTTGEPGAPKIKVRIAGKTAEELMAIQPTSKRPLWADLVMGTTEKLIPMVPRSPIGIGTVTIRTTLPDSTFVRTAATARDGVSVKYQLKKRVGNGDFLEYGEVKDIPVFTVDAAELETRTSWKIETIFDEEY